MPAKSSTAKDIFGIRSAIVVAREYHLYRALYNAGAFDIEANGIRATGHEFAGRTRWEMREILARVKDFFWCLTKPDPTYRGEQIDIQENGEVTAG